ncbi:MAG: HAD hydrolase-like protein [Phycisphaerales bacterium]|jgi:phosphoglycolate phosphatase-like HAD superfamily hydrolase|nr:HAD hydrolase-like protein [Phycisphaerales bacterium]
MLLLFDIDGTLLKTGGAGVAAFAQAGQHLYGSAFSLDGIQLAGRLDRHILADALQACGHPRCDHASFLDEYRRRLSAGLDAGAWESRPLPGARALVEMAHTHPDWTCGLLTGNWSETGTLKLQAAGFDLTHFVVRAWAGDGSDRPGLVRAALSRWGGAGDDAVVIGDTPHDVHCGQAHGCRTIGVTTGPFGRAELEAAGADLVVDDLTDTARLTAWLEMDR